MRKIPIISVAFLIAGLQYLLIYKKLFMRDFHSQVWHKSHCLVLNIYYITKKFPKDEIYGVTKQMRRAVVSIPCNIAEGCGRNSLPDLQGFLTIANGSASELEYQLLLSKDLRYLSDKDYTRLNSDLIEIKKMIHSLSLNIKF